MRGKCNCGKKATSEWLSRGEGAAWALKFCKDCAPKYNSEQLTLIHGKN